MKRQIFINSCNDFSKLSKHIRNGIEDLHYMISYDAEITATVIPIIYNIYILCIPGFATNVRI